MNYKNASSFLFFLLASHGFAAPKADLAGQADFEDVLL